MTEPRVTRKKITEYLPDAHNANRGTERGHRVLDDSITEVGLGRSVLADKNGKLIGGNKTQQAAVDNGFEDAIEIETDGKTLVVVKRTDLDLNDPEPNNPARRMAYYDNRVSQLNLDFDPAILLHDLETGVDLSKLWNDDELAELLARQDDEPLPDGGAQIDRAAELQAKWQVQRGDVWRIGKHRVMCGDSTSTEDVARLMDGKCADLQLTDPPYGVERDEGFEGFEGFGGFGNPIARRQYEGGWDSERPSRETFSLILQQAKHSIIFGGNFFADLLPQSTHWIVWDKLNTMPTFGDCELAWTSFPRKSVKKITFEYNGLLGKEKERFHATQKPVGLFALLLKEYSEDNTLILDTFAGSGTTLVAAEQTNRMAFGMELDESFCAVIIQRLTDMGLTAERVS